MTPMATRQMPRSELSLAEMLVDPIVQTVMARDGVIKAELEGLIHAARRDVLAESALNQLQIKSKDFAGYQGGENG
jgi:hypothetical protein